MSFNKSITIELCFHAKYNALRDSSLRVVTRLGNRLIKIRTRISGKAICHGGFFPKRFSKTISNFFGNSFWEKYFRVGFKKLLPRHSTLTQFVFTLKIQFQRSSLVTFHCILYFLQSYIYLLLLPAPRGLLHSLHVS